jgi:hypothetical protein
MDETTRAGSASRGANTNAPDEPNNTKDKEREEENANDSLKSFIVGYGANLYCVPILTSLNPASLWIH